MNSELLIRIGGALHFCILAASATAPFAAKWREGLGPLPLLLRQMFWVYASFIVLVIVAFGALALCFPAELASNHPLGRAVSAFIALFWLARLTVQFFVFDARPYLTNWVLRIGYHTLTVIFIYLAAVFGWTAVF